jgi:AcrR family transcriptional regulator
MNLEQNILKQAESLFMKYGVKSVTMDDIVREMGISKKTLYQLYDNKAALIKQVICNHLEDEHCQFENLHASSANAIEEILKVARHVVQQLKHISSNVVFDLRKYYRESYDLLESMNRKYVYQSIRSNIEWGQKEGLYLADIDADIISKLYSARAFMITDETLFPESQYDKEKLLKQYFFYHIRGIASKKGLELLEEYSK